jgi:hypothetical protein
MRKDVSKYRKILQIVIKVEDHENELIL